MNSERLFSENSGLRREIFELESELVGAREMELNNLSQS